MREKISYARLKRSRAFYEGRVWELTTCSIRGYARMIEWLIGELKTSQLKHLVKTLEGKGD